MSDAPTHTDDDLAGIGFEPDIVPAGFVVRLSIGLTLAVLASVVFTWFYFRSTVADELHRKGYDVDASAVVDLGGK